MQIIDELEPDKRGLYAGAVGYLGFNGDMDLAIAIRTALVKDGRMHVQAGAGIVADSVPESEWQETRAKARAILRAAEIAENGMGGGWGEKRGVAGAGSGAPRRRGSGHLGRGLRSAAADRPQSTPVRVVRHVLRSPLHVEMDLGNVGFHAVHVAVIPHLLAE